MEFIVKWVAFLVRSSATRELEISNYWVEITGRVCSCAFSLDGKFKIYFLENSKNDVEIGARKE